MSPPPSPGRAVDWILSVLAVVIFLAAVFVAAVHVDDRFAVDHASGARIALARSTTQGTLYPPLVDGDQYGGTRFMPLPVLLHAGVSRLTGEYLLSGKLVAYLTMGAVLWLVAVMLRRSGCRWPLTAALLASILVAQTGLLALTGLRGDSLPLLLQLLAVFSLTRLGGGKASTVVSAAFAALALIAKLHALWAPVAIAVWLWRRDRRRLGWFAAAYAALAVVMLGGLLLATNGRLLDNVVGLSTAGVSGLGGVISAPFRAFQLTVEQATTGWALLPVALLALGLAWRRDDLSVEHLGLPAAAAILLVVLTDIGTGGNQLIDVVVLSVIVTGDFAVRSRREEGDRSLATVLVAVTVAWVALSGLVTTIIPAVRDTVATLGDPQRYRSAPLEGLADAETSLLSEDPYVPVSLGQDPVVLDPFMLLRIARQQPTAVQPLIDRIDAQAFDLVVLVQPLADRQWWAEYHFGTDVVAAIDRAYQLSERVQGYDVYRPREDAG